MGRAGVVDCCTVSSLRPILFPNRAGDCNGCSNCVSALWSFSLDQRREVRCVQRQNGKVQQMREAIYRTARSRSDNGDRQCSFLDSASDSTTRTGGTTRSCGRAIRRSAGRAGNTCRRRWRKGHLEREPIALNRLPNVLLVCAVLGTLHHRRYQVQRLGAPGRLVVRCNRRNPSASDQRRSITT